MREILTAAGIAVVIATITACLQVYIKANSRPGADNKQYWWNRCQKEDAIFWSDWVTAGTVAAVSFWLKELSSNNHLNPAWFLGTLLIVVGSMSALPSIFGSILYDGYDSSGNPKLKSGPWWIILVDAIGLVLMIATVFGGARIG